MSDAMKDRDEALAEEIRLERQLRALGTQAAELKKTLRELARVNGEVTYTRRGLQTHPEISRIMIDQIV